jgi:predicted RNA methylase
MWDMHNRTTVERNKHDFYPTPVSIIDALLDNLNWGYVAVWEPCAGDMRVVDILRRRGNVVIPGDIQTGQNFFEYTEAPVPTLITNPPFKHIRPFIDHAFEIGVQRMALVCPERLWACQKGRDQFARHQPSRFINMDWREDYLGKGGKPDRALAVSIWNTPHSTTTSYEIWSRPHGHSKAA